MKYCPNCGTAIEDNVNFCPKCGTALSATEQSCKTAPTKLHCPNCKSINLISSTESSNGSAITTNSGGFAVTTVKQEYKNFWICRDCGTKFRNVQGVSEELAKRKKGVVGYSIATVICLILCIIIYSVLPPEDDFDFVLITLPAMAAPLAFFISSVIFAIASAVSIKKLTAEKEYLEKNCFD